MKIGVIHIILFLSLTLSATFGFAQERPATPVFEEGLLSIANSSNYAVRSSDLQNETSSIKPVLKITSSSEPFERFRLFRFISLKSELFINRKRSVYRIPGANTAISRRNNFLYKNNRLSEIPGPSKTRMWPNILKKKMDIKIEGSLSNYKILNFRPKSLGYKPSASDLGFIQNLTDIFDIVDFNYAESSRINQVFEFSVELKPRQNSVFFGLRYSGPPENIYRPESFDWFNLQTKMSTFSFILGFYLSGK